MSKLDTSCKKCIFADYEGITQIGCKFSKLDDFVEKEVSVIEAYDEEKEFYVVKNRRCMFHRPSTWKHSSITFLEQERTIRKEVQISYQAIVIVRTLAQTKKTVESLVNQTIKPSYITLIKPLEVDLDTKSLKRVVEVYDIPWRVQGVTNPDIPFGLTIDFAITRRPYPYYSVFNDGCVVPKDTFETINTKMVDDLQQIAILKPNSNDDGLFVSIELHKILQGNQDVGMVNKTIVMDPSAKLQSITDLCPNFPK